VRRNDRERVEPSNPVAEKRYGRVLGGAWTATATPIISTLSGFAGVP
jgi:hypothetical protein